MAQVLKLRRVPLATPPRPARSGRAVQLTLDFDGRSNVVSFPRRPAPAVAGGPDLAEIEALFARACDLEEKDPRRARELYARVIEIEPGHVEARVNLGRLFHEAGDMSGAEALYRRALEIRPDATAFFNLGTLLDDLGRFPESIRAYECALELDARLADAHYNLAALLERLGDPRGALRHLHAYRKLIRPPR